MAHRTGGAVVPKPRWGRAGALLPPARPPPPPFLPMRPREIADYPSLSPLYPSSSSIRRRRMLTAPLFPFPLFFPGLQFVFSEHLSPQPLGPRPPWTFVS